MSVLINAAGCTVNVALYAVWGHWWSLAAAVFCGLMTIVAAIWETS